MTPGFPRPPGTAAAPGAPRAPLSPGRDDATGPALTLAPRYLGLTLGLVVAAFLALVAYWVIWFFVNRAWLASLDTPSYYVFENAFPAADAWLAIACALGGWALWRRRSSALFWLLAGGSASIYLGLMDVLFDLENRVYLAPHGDWGSVATEIAINVYSLGVGAWALSFGWRNRRWFLTRP
ncbi:MAG TPA: hypothetical protein VIY73_26860 [Polyangiaceae bacterium]